MRAEITLALETCRRHKLRTLSGVIGMLLAAAVTQGILAIHEGARREALKQLEALGAGAIVVLSRSPEGLTLRDAARIREVVPSAGAVVPVLNAQRDVAGPAAVIPASVAGVTATLADVHRVAVRRGRRLTVRDDRDGARVCLVAEPAAQRLFGRRDPMGQPVRIGEEWYRVVGIAGGPVLDAEVIVPLAALAGGQPAPRLALSAIWLRVDPPERAGQTAALLRTHAPPGAEIIVPAEAAAARDRTPQLFTVLAGLTAGLLFLLGGASIANLLLMSVLERTAEIGLRRAVGATRRAIGRQFLLEAAGMALAGGIGGIVTGLSVSAAAARYGGWPVALSPGVVVPVLAAVILVGLASGWYPASRAARVQPIEALSHL